MLDQFGLSWRGREILIGMGLEEVWRREIKEREIGQLPERIVGLRESSLDWEKSQHVFKLVGKIQ